MTFVTRNSTTQRQLDIDPNCYYSGGLKDDSTSFVTVNLCNGMVSDCFPVVSFSTEYEGRCK